MRRIVSTGLTEVRKILQLVPEELSANVDIFTSDNDDVLPVEQLLGYRRRESSKKMALAIDDDLLFECRHRSLLSVFPRCLRLISGAQTRSAARLFRDCF